MTSKYSHKQRERIIEKVMELWKDGNNIPVACEAVASMFSLPVEDINKIMDSPIAIRCDVCDEEIITVNNIDCIEIVDEMVEEGDNIYHRSCYEAKYNQQLTRWTE